MHPGGLIAACIIIEFAVFSEQSPNNSRAKTIGQHLTSGGTGTVTGWSRFVFSAGCAAGPGVSLVLHRAAVWLPWLCTVVIATVALGSYLLCGVSLWTDPDWSTIAVSQIETQTVPHGP